MDHIKCSVKSNRLVMTMDSKVCKQIDSFQKVISKNGVLLPTSMSESSRTALDLRPQSSHAADRWNGFGQSYNPGPECTGWNTHIALVAGVQVWSCGRFASEDTCCLLHLEAAVIQGFVKLPHLWLQWAGIPCGVNHKGHSVWFMPSLSIKRPQIAFQLWQSRKGMCWENHTAGLVLPCQRVRHVRGQASECASWGDSAPWAWQRALQWILNSLECLLPPSASPMAIWVFDTVEGLPRDLKRYQPWPRHPETSVSHAHLASREGFTLGFLSVDHRDISALEIPGCIVPLSMDSS